MKQDSLVLITGDAEQRVPGSASHHLVYFCIYLKFSTHKKKVFNFKNVLTPS